MNIAVFDENQTHREFISFLIQDYCENHMLSQKLFLFDRLPNLLSHAMSGKLDLIFINITAPILRQLKTSCLFREIHSGPLLVFTLLETDLTASLLRTHAFAFLLKPFERAEFARVFERCLKQLPPSEYFITVKEARQMVRISLCDIMYTSNDNHYVCIHTKKRIVRTYMPFSHFQEMLSGHNEFVLYYRNSAVNMHYIEQISKNCILMQNGDTLPLCRSLQIQTRQAYSEFCQYR